MKAAKVIAAVQAGELDEGLSKIISIAIERNKEVRRARALSAAAALEPGDRVQVIEGIRPQYMVGHVGQIAMPPENSRRQHKAGFIWVDFGRRIQGPRRAWGPLICMPAGCLKKVK